MNFKFLKCYTYLFLSQKYRLSIRSDRKSEGKVYSVHTLCDSLFRQASIVRPRDLVCSPARQNDVPFCMFPVLSYIYPADVGRPRDRVYSVYITKMYYICDTFEVREKEVSFYCATVISFKDLPAGETCSWHFMWDLSPVVFMRKKVIHVTNYLTWR